MKEIKSITVRVPPLLELELWVGDLSHKINAHNEELRGILERLKALEGRAGIVVAEDKDGEA